MLKTNLVACSLLLFSTVIFPSEACQQAKYCTAVQCWQKTPCAQHPKDDYTAIRNLPLGIRKIVIDYICPLVEDLQPQAYFYRTSSRPADANISRRIIQWDKSNNCIQVRPCERILN